MNIQSKKSYFVRKFITYLGVFAIFFIAAGIVSNLYSGRGLLEVPNFGNNVGGDTDNIVINETKGLKKSKVVHLSKRDDEIARIVELVSPSVVSIRSGSNDLGSNLEQGSGVIITAQGHIITNYHVIDSPSLSAENEYLVELSGGRLVHAVLLKVDTFLDLALLKIVSDEIFQPIAFGNSDQVKVGHKVFAFGNPFGLGVSFSEGNIAAKNRFLSELQHDLFQMTAPLNPGQSGGPLVNVCGELVGINSSIYSKNKEYPGFQGIAFSIQSNEVQDSVKSMMLGVSKARGYLGVTLSELSNHQRDTLGLDTAGGAMVQGVVRNSPAQEAGVKGSDVITSFNEKRIIEPRHLIGLLKKNANKEVTLGLWSDGKEKKVNITLSQAEMSKMRGDEESESMQSDILTNYGFQVQDLSSIEKKYIYGVKIKSITSDSVAEKLGLQKGDYFLLINGQHIDVANAFLDLFRASSAQRETLIIAFNKEKGYFRLRIPKLADLK